jgi:heterotetrameric sarcosine oxidase delta subunit
MTALACPFCGPRELGEFEFLKTLPNADSREFSRIYERIDLPSRSVELWQHVGGCRAWLQAQRNPSSGEIYEILLLGQRRP